MPFHLMSFSSDRNFAKMSFHPIDNIQWTFSLMKNSSERLRGCDIWPTNEPWHGISNNVGCVTSKALDQPVHTCSLTRAYASGLNIL